MLTYTNTSLQFEANKLAWDSQREGARSAHIQRKSDAKTARPNTMLGIGTMLLLLLAFQVAQTVEAIGKSPKISKHICDPSTLSHPVLDGVTVTSLSVTLQSNYSTPSSDIFSPFSNLNFCEVNIHLTHFDASDDVLVRVWLPSARDDWNSRFQATGGGGFATSMGFVGLATAVVQGYAAVSTDGGHNEWSWTSMEWVLNSDRSIAGACG